MRALQLTRWAGCLYKKSLKHRTGRRTLSLHNAESQCQAPGNLSVLGFCVSAGGGGHGVSVLDRYVWVTCDANTEFPKHMSPSWTPVPTVKSGDGTFLFSEVTVWTGGSRSVRTLGMFLCSARREHFGNIWGGRHARGFPRQPVPGVSTTYKLSAIKRSVYKWAGLQIPLS